MAAIHFRVSDAGGNTFEQATPPPPPPQTQQRQQQQQPPPPPPPPLLLLLLHVFGRFRVFVQMFRFSAAALWPCWARQLYSSASSSPGTMMGLQRPFVGQSAGWE